jgi:hypothetical protein
MVGFPHSEIPGSKLIRSSPRLIAAYYVLHRLHAPRHPLDALKALDRSHYPCPHPPSPLLQGPNDHRARTKATPCDVAILIGQIKKPEFTCDYCASAGCASNGQQCISLRCPKIRPAASHTGRQRPNLLSDMRRFRLLAACAGCRAIRA